MKVRALRPSDHKETDSFRPDLAEIRLVGFAPIAAVPDSLSVAQSGRSPGARHLAVNRREEAGLTVVEFDDSADVADYLRTHSPDVAAIFTDVKLKGHVEPGRMNPYFMLVVCGEGHHRRRRQLLRAWACEGLELQPHAEPEIGAHDRYVTV